MEPRRGRRFSTTRRAFFESGFSNLRFEIRRGNAGISSNGVEFLVSIFEFRISIFELRTMKLLDGNVLPGDTLTVDGDMKRGEIRLERARAKAVQG
jgi:hypothetical protein